MSAVPLAEESVYNLIPAGHGKKESQRLYRSKHAASAAVPPSCSTFGFLGTSKVCGNVAGKANAAEDAESHPAVKGTGAMGRAVANEIDPKQFLKRTTATTVKVAGNPAPGGAAGGARVKSPLKKSTAATTNAASASSASGDAEEQQAAAAAAAAAAQHQQRIHATVRPGVPTRTEKPVMGLASGKNFVSDNARELAGAHPKPAKEESRAVDGADFGKVPKYLQNIKRALDDEKSVAKSRAVAVATAVDYDELTAAEAQELRDGLQRRWDELSRAIKALPFKLETRSQIRRKEVLEQDFAAVEAAQAKLSRKRILVMKD